MSEEEAGGGERQRMGGKGEEGRKKNDPTDVSSISL